MGLVAVCAEGPLGCCAGPEPGITICSSCWRLLPEPPAPGAFCDPGVGGLPPGVLGPPPPIMLFGVLAGAGEDAEVEVAGLIGLGDIVAGDRDEVGGMWGLGC